MHRARVCHLCFVYCIIGDAFSHGVANLYIVPTPLYKSPVERCHVERDICGSLLCLVSCILYSVFCILCPMPYDVPCSLFPCMTFLYSCIYFLGQRIPPLPTSHYI